MTNRHDSIIGEVWEQVKGSKKGRRGRVIRWDDNGVTLTPETGTCPCPATQRITHLKWDTFERDWQYVP